MKRLLIVLVTISIAILIAATIYSIAINDDIEIHQNSSLTVRNRTRRYLTFFPTSKILFRILLKDTFPFGAGLISHGSGIRCNLELMQPDFHQAFLNNAKKRTELLKKHKLQRRQVYDSLKTVMNYYGLEGHSCVLKTFCDVLNGNGTSNGMLFQIFKLIFS
jgi:hypothetical protein